jgi:hypothetical protein
MPRELAVAFAGQDNCKITISKNTVDTAGWSFTPLTSHDSLQRTTLLLLNARTTGLSKLDFLVLADDHGALSSIGVTASSAPALRSLKVQVIDIISPFASRRLRMSQKVVVKGLAWLRHPLRRAERCPRLEELELTNVCVCGSKCSALDEMIVTRISCDH